MGGQAAVSTLDRLAEEPGSRTLLTKIRKPDGSWKVSDRVWVSYLVGRRTKQGPLTVGFGEGDREIGPELLFGHVLGEACAGPLLLVKVTQGPMSLGVEGRPPSSGAPGPFYKKMIDTVRTVLADPHAHHPHYRGQGCEVAGFVWFQEWNDHLRPNLMAQYEANLVNLIRDVRRDLGVPRLPVVIGDMGIEGNNPNPLIRPMRKAQAAAARRPEFTGSVRLVHTAPYWDAPAHALLRKGFDPIKNNWHDEAVKKQFERLGCKPEFLYLGSGKTFALIGQAFGEAMTELWRRPGSQTR
jgi:alpha-galactosidase